jgi:AcrR family transcriptional regulator
MSPRTPQQQAVIRDQSRRLILDKALELFASHGYHDTTMEQLARTAGVSKGLIYHYYAGKKELLTAIIEDGFNSFSDPQEWLENHDSRQVLAFILDQFLKLAKDSIRFWRLYYSLMLQSGVFEEIVGQFRSHFSEMRNLLTGLFRELEYENPEQEALFFAGAVEGILMHYMIDVDNYPLTAVREFIVSRYNLPDVN